MAKKRADVLLFEQGGATSRSKAESIIISGSVYIGERKIDKPGTQLTEDAVLEVRAKEHPWVSRGGMKLAHALKEFSVDPAGFTCIDVGSSTGGFTDVLLTHKAPKVYAVDVGFGQLDWGLRNDERVVVMERQNARYLTAELIPDPLDMIVCDASFIGLRTVLPAAMKLAKDGAIMMALIKPQFEAGKENLKKGIVRDPEIHKRVCDEIKDWLQNEMNWDVQGITQSPITGAKGNIEFLVYAIKKA
ncbi:MAG: TlyA family RNA methyltransferase [Alphaproteobacteria bacterium]